MKFFVKNSLIMAMLFLVGCTTLTTHDECNHFSFPRKSPTFTVATMGNVKNVSVYEYSVNQGLMPGHTYNLSINMTDSYVTEDPNIHLIAMVILSKGARIVNGIIEHDNNHYQSFYSGFSDTSNYLKVGTENKINASFKVLHYYIQYLEVEYH